jgi:hypothetical protein
MAEEREQLGSQRRLKGVRNHEKTTCGTFSFVIFLLNFSEPLVRSQGLDGTLRGEVKDQGDAVVVGATR